MEHFNESILNDEILANLKKDRIDHMTYLPGMEVLESDTMRKVLEAMETYDYHHYTESDIMRALEKEVLSTEDFGALLSLHQFISQIIVQTIVFIVVLIAIIR